MHWCSLIRGLQSHMYIVYYFDRGPDYLRSLDKVLMRSNFIIRQPNLGCINIITKKSLLQWHFTLHMYHEKQILWKLTPLGTDMDKLVIVKKTVDCKLSVCKSSGRKTCAGQVIRSWGQRRVASWCLRISGHLCVYIQAVAAVVHQNLVCLK